MWGAVGLVAIVLGTVATFGPAPALLVIGVLAAASAVMLLRRFDVLLHLLLLSVFVESVGVGSVRVGRVLAVVALLVVAARMLFTNWRPSRPLPIAAILPVAAFLSWAWASGFWAADTGAWAFAMGQLALAVSYFLAFTLFVERIEQVRSLLRTFVYGAVFASFVAFAQVAAGDPRAEGLQGDPNIYALYQVAALPAAAVVAATAGHRHRVAAYAAMPLIIASVLATQSRGGLLTTLGVLLLLLARGDLGSTLRRHRAAAMTTGLVLTVAVLTAAMTLNPRFAPDRVAGDRGSGRIDIWYVAFREWQDNALLGVGGGNFLPRSVELLVTEPGVDLLRSRLLLSTGIEVHNIYLETLVEYGAVGCLLFLTVLLATAWNLQSAARRSDYPVLRALPMVLVAFLAASFFLSVVNNKLLWTLVALSVVVAGRPGLETASGGYQQDRPDAGRTGLPQLRVLAAPAAVPCIAAALMGAVSASALLAVTPQTHAASALYVVGIEAAPPEQESTVRTLEALITGPVVAADVKQATGSPLTGEQISDRIEISRPEGSLVFTATVLDDDADQARELAEALARVFPERVASLSGVDGEGPARFTLRLWADGAVVVTALPRPTTVAALLGAALGGTAALLAVAGWAAGRPLALAPPLGRHVLFAPGRVLRRQPQVAGQR